MCPTRQGTGPASISATIAILASSAVMIAAASAVTAKNPASAKNGINFNLAAPRNRFYYAGVAVTLVYDFKGDSNEPLDLPF
jgi:hypothetical protein